MAKAPNSITIDVVSTDATAPVQRLSLSPGRYTVGRSRDNAIVLDAAEISRVHLILHVDAAGIEVEDNASTHGTRIGERVIERERWSMDEPIVVPRFEIRAAGSTGAGRTASPEAAPQAETVAAASAIEFSRIVGVEDPQAAGRAFPGELFASPVVSTAAIRASGYLAGETTYAAVGGGIGSFIWVDHMRVFGVPAEHIRVIGVNPVCYSNWGRYCQNSQIPLHERIRSNAISTPDNIWGFPGYAGRESWRALLSGNIAGTRPVFQVFGEAGVAESYTPLLENIFTSIDREAARIGWTSMLEQGRVLGLRMTDDGRYAVAYRRTADRADGGRRDNILIASYVHVCTGYPATRFTGDLQAFRAAHRNDASMVVNAYDPHDQIYSEIEASGRPERVMVRGRGIVASRVIQRLHEARARNPQVEIVHQMRSRVADSAGSRWGPARRPVFNDVELQPFNWPKACWGGDLRQQIEAMTPQQRAETYKVLGGTSTADRKDWKDIAINGAREGWYIKAYGNVDSMKPTGPSNNRQVAITFKDVDGQMAAYTVDYIVDCTGLIADVTQSPFLADLISTFGLARNPTSGSGAENRLAGIAVANSFEIPGLRNGNGRVYAAGTITQNGPYAAVDSFLGLAYAALRAVDDLNAASAPGVSSFGPARSFTQWLRWCAGSAP